MTFLYPSFLWALGVLAIPVIIHLFNFRRTTRVLFSNTRFLKKVKESTTAKRKLKHYLILASRLLFLLFLVLAFAQPMLPAEEDTVNHQSVIFYLDNSQSMSAPLEERIRGLDAAITFVTRLAEAFPADSRYKLLTNDFAPYSNSFKTRTELLEILSQLRLSPVSRSISEVKERMARDQSREQEIFWISDFQKSTAGTPAQSRLDSTAKWHLVPIVFDDLPNVFIDTVYLDNPFASSGERNVVRAKVRNDGSQDVDQLTVKLAINGIQSGSSTLRVPAGGISEAVFDLTTRLTGLNRAVITFNDFPVSFDNEFYFTLNYNEKIRIVEIKGSDNVTPIERVFGNRQIFQYRGHSVSNFNYSLLNEADLIVINGLNSIDQPLQIPLQEYFNRGGVALFIPGREPNAEALRTFLQLPVLTRVPSRVEPQELDKPEYNNPFFENVFEERSPNMVMPKAGPVLDWGVDRAAILHFKNDKPFLSRVSRGGILYILASPLESGYTDFHNHALFVPVMYRIASSSKKNEQKLYYNLRETLLTLRIDSAADEGQIRLVGEEEVIPSQRKIGQLVTLDLPRYTLKTGFYKVVSSRDTVDMLAFNPDKAESLMARHDENTIRSYFGNGENITIFDASETETFSNQIKERYLGTPLWKYAIILALLFLAAEVLLIRFLK